MRLLCYSLFVVFFTSKAILAQTPGQPPKVEALDDKKVANQPEKTGVVKMMVSSEDEKLADEAGQIYINRGYKGIVPGVREETIVPSKKGKKDESEGTPTVLWVGFQPFPSYSRVFIQISGKFSYTITKPKPNKIEVKIPNAVVSGENDLRTLETWAFPSAVERVIIQAPPVTKDTVIINIFLRKPVGYLYRQEGQYIFVDIEK